MHRHRAGVVGSDTRLCFELFHPLRHGTLCGRAFAILPKSNSFAAFCHWWSRPRAWPDEAVKIRYVLRVSKSCKREREE